MHAEECRLGNTAPGSTAPSALGRTETKEGGGPHLTPGTGLVTGKTGLQGSSALLKNSVLSEQSTLRTGLSSLPQCHGGKGTALPRVLQTAGGRLLESVSEGDRHRFGGGVKLLESCHLLPSNKAVPCSAPLYLQRGAVACGQRPGCLLQGLPSPSLQTEVSPHLQLAKFLLSL